MSLKLAVLTLGITHILALFEYTACDTANECSGQTLNFSKAIYFRGYRSGQDVDASSDLPLPQNREIDCSGSHSCIESRLSANINLGEVLSAFDSNISLISEG